MKTMKNLFLRSALLVAVIIFTGCEKDIIIFDASMNLVGFNTGSVLIPENSGGSIPLYLGAPSNAKPTTVTLEFSTEGLDNPAEENTDFTVSSKQIEAAVGINNITITPVNNDLFTGNKSFIVTIASNSEGYKIAVQDEVLVTIVDDEHPLKDWIGTYTVSATSYGKPGDWDETWTVTTSPVSGDPTKLELSGVGSGDAETIVASFDLDNMTISLAPGQSLGDCYGAGPTVVFKGTPDLSFIEDEPLVGVITAGGGIHVDLWGHKITEGQYAGAWDVFNTTWTKNK